MKGKVKIRKTCRKCLFIGIGCFILFAMLSAKHKNLQSSVLGIGVGCKSFPDINMKNISSLSFELLYSDRSRIWGYSSAIGINKANEFMGVQLSSLSNVNRKVYGCEAGGINCNYDGFYGIQAGILNFISSGSSAGLQMGICNYMPLLDAGRENRFFGLQFGVVNLVESYDLEWPCVTGAQVGFFNAGMHCDGMQLGTINAAGSVCGVQCGIINLSIKLKGVQFGLFNYNEYGGWHKIFPFVNW